MQPSVRAIHRNLLSRVVAVTALLTVLGGGSSYVYERGRVAEAISEQAGWATELLKARVDAKLAARGGSWQSRVQEVLDDLAGHAPLAALGSFIVVEVNDSNGRKVGSLISDPTVEVMDALPPLPNKGALGAPGIRLGSVLDEGKLPLVPVLISVAGTDSSVEAYIRGLFEISAETLSRLQRRTAYSTFVVTLAVLVTAIVIFPIVRRLTSRLTTLSSQLLDANLQSLRLLGSAIAKRDSDTDAHNYRVTVYAVRLAEQAGLDNPAIRSLIKGAFLHDVGKIGTPDRVLLKPDKLDEEEFTEMKRHVSHGLDIVAESSWLRDAVAVVGYHHEKFDGSGYHDGLSGTSIPVAARIFCIADVFDALTSERPYKKAFSLKRSLQIMRESSGRHFDPVLLHAFEGIAEPLHRSFVETDASARQALDSIISRYFRQNLDAILRDVSP